jgi:hypothetical protein
MPESSIRVYHRDGSPASGVRVVLGYSLGNTSPAYTDSSGEARVTHRSEGRATLYVDGREYGSVQTPGQASLTVR